MIIGLTAILRDRGPYLKEWISFHYLVGFRKFYLYTHSCSDNTIDVINGLKLQFDIKNYTVSESIQSPQLNAYRHSYAEHNHEVDWMAFIDGDEFLFSPDNLDIKIPLEKYSYERLSALGVYWACYGSNDHIEEPQGLIIKNFTRRAKLSFEKNRHVKSLVIGRQGSMIEINNPHTFDTQYGTYDELFRPINNGFSEHAPSHEYFRINHYVTQSYNYYIQKKSQYTRPDNDKQRDSNFWQDHNINDVEDACMEKFWQPLDDILGAI